LRRAPAPGGRIEPHDRVADAKFGQGLGHARLSAMKPEVHAMLEPRRPPALGAKRGTRTHVIRRDRASGTWRILLLPE
jgi:hypothetical protein